MTLWPFANAWRECGHYLGQGTRHSPLLLIVVYVRVILRNHLTPAHHEPRERIHDPHCHPQATPHLSQHLLFKPFECCCGATKKVSIALQEIYLRIEKLECFVVIQIRF